MRETAAEGGVIGLEVSGMTCGMCVEHVTYALEKVPGVSAAEVTLAPPRARVRYDPARTSPDALVRAVRSAGYDVRP